MFLSQYQTTKRTSLRRRIRRPINNAVVVHHKNTIFVMILSRASIHTTCLLYDSSCAA